MGRARRVDGGEIHNKSVTREDSQPPHFGSGLKAGLWSGVVKRGKGEGEKLIIPVRRVDSQPRPLGSGLTAGLGSGVVKRGKGEEKRARGKDWGGNS